MSTITSTAVSGILASQQRVAKSAENIVKAGAGLSDTDQTEELVNIKQASNDFEANATVLKVSKDLNDTLLDVLA